MVDRLVLENAARKKGFTVIAGVDEAGRGALFGPVVAGAVILKDGKELEPYRDSKKLSENRREELFEKLREDGHLCGVGVVSAGEIDRTDILRATLKAMALAVMDLPVSPQWLLVDGLHAPDVSCPGEVVVGGDDRSSSIAAASILAKVTRDRMIRRFDGEYPEYGLMRNKGYGTAQHFNALRKYGPTPLHRLSFKGVSGEGTLWH